MTLDVATHASGYVTGGLATPTSRSSSDRHTTPATTRALTPTATPQALTHEPPTASYADALARTPDEIALVEHAGMHLLQQIWGLDDYEARDVLQAADMRIDIAVSAWLDSGEHLVKTRCVGDAPPPHTRLAIALRTARKLRLAVALRFAHERTLEMTHIHRNGPGAPLPHDPPYT